jgi:hypothetical protein
MTDPAGLLERKLKLWYKVNEPRPSPVPEVSAPSSLPAASVDPASVDRGIASGLSNLRVFEGSQWETSCLRLSALVADLPGPSRKRLLDSLGLISSPPPVEPEILERWIAAVTGLPRATHTTAVMEFFQIAWMWGQISAVVDVELEGVLALFHAAMKRLGEGTRSSAMAHFLVKLAGRWPERFCYWLECTAEHGDNVIQALKRSEGLLDEAKPFARESLLDFGAEMGWKLLDEESLPIWRAIARNGELLYRRLRGFAVPESSMRLLSGVLGGLDDTRGMDRVLTSAAARAVRQKFGDADTGQALAVLERIPDVRDALVSAVEVELSVEVLSLRGFLSSPERTGRAMVAIAAAASGSSMLENLNALVDSMHGNVSETEVESTAALSRYLSAREIDMELDLLMRAGNIAETIAAGPDGNALANPFRKLVGRIAALDDPGASLDILEQAWKHAACTPGEAVSSASFLLRSQAGLSDAELMELVPVVAEIMCLLAPQDRRKLLGGLPPEWFDELVRTGRAALSEVLDALKKIAEEERRGRFLEMIVSPLLEEISADEDAFSEYLTLATADYNKPGNVDSLREVERNLLGRLFRAGDRSRVVETSIARLLQLPGLEGHRADDLLNRAKLLSEAFSTQAVWEKQYSAAFSRFVNVGLQNLVRVMVGHPDAIDELTEERLTRLIDRIMPSGSGESDNRVASWQIDAGAVFFGQALPLAVELTARKPGKLMPFLDRLSRTAVRSSHGVPAGEDYLSEVVIRLEQHLIEEYTIRIQSELTGKPAVPTRLSEEWASELFEIWQGSRRQENALMKEARRVAQVLTTDPEQRSFFLRGCRRLAIGLSRAGLLEATAFVRDGRGQDIAKLRRSVGGADLIDVFRSYEHGGEILELEQLVGAERFFDALKDTGGENPCRYWRKRVFSTFCNCVIDLMLVASGKPEQARDLIESFLEVAEFLGTESGGENLLLALERSLAVKQGREPVKDVPAAARNLEKQLFRPLWRRRAMSRLELLIAGMENRDQLVDRLLDRLSYERGIAAQVNFLRRFGLLYLAIEEAVLSEDSKRLDLHVHEALEDTWLINPKARRQDSAVETAREAFETAMEVFRRIRVRRGVVSAEEAEEISSEMRRRYRDNADSVAILLRWTMDPEKQGILTILEERPQLLEAASTDTELLSAMDAAASFDGFADVLEETMGDPERMKRRLRELTEG